MRYHNHLYAIYNFKKKNLLFNVRYHSLFCLCPIHIEILKANFRGEVESIKILKRSNVSSVGWLKISKDLSYILWLIGLRDRICRKNGLTLIGRRFQILCSVINSFDK